MVLPGMLHLAIVRSPVAHAKITNVDVTRGPAGARRRRRLHRPRLRRGAGLASRAPGRSRRTWSTPGTRRSPSRRSTTSARPSRSSSPAARPPRRTPSSSSTSTTTRCRSVLDMEEAVGQDAAPRATTTSTSNKSFHFVFDAGEAGTGRRHRAGVRRRRGRRQPAVRPAAADPGVHGAALGRRPAAGRQLHDVVVDPDPAHPAADAGDGHRHRPSTSCGSSPPTSAAASAASCRSRPRRCSPSWWPRAAGQAGQVDRDPQRVADERPPRPRPDPVHRHRRRPRGQRQGPEGAASSPTWAPTCGWSARACRCSARSCTPASTSSRPTGSTARASSPTRRPPTPTAAPAGRRPRSRSSGSWTSSPSSSDMDPLELRRKNWIKAEEFPFTTVAGLEYDSGDYDAATQQALELLGYDELRAEQQRRRESNDPVQLGIGFSTFTEMCGLAPSRVLGSLSYGAGGWEHAVHPDAAHRQGRGGHRLDAARPGPRDGVEPDRRRPARRAVRGRRGAARRHRDLLPRAWTPTAPGRWSVGGAAVVKAAREGGRQGPQGRRAPARGQRGRPGVRRRAVLRRGHARAPGSSIQEIALAIVRGAQLPGRHRAVDRRRRDLRPGELLLPARHAHLRHGGRHRDRHGEDPQVRLRRRRRRRSSTR